MKTTIGMAMIEMTTVQPAIGTSSAVGTTTITIPTELREPVTQSWTVGSYMLAY
jgi:hypothetical protein